jgi:hypothetical protein
MIYSHLFEMLFQANFSDEYGGINLWPIFRDKMRKNGYSKEDILLAACDVKWFEIYTDKLGRTHTTDYSILGSFDKLDKLYLELKKTHSENDDYLKLKAMWKRILPNYSGRTHHLAFNLYDCYMGKFL